ncbi:MAG: HNH endonuclease [Ruminococcus flavefaciens]|nr:HNH endonuclease [Ruminococcus flavefaciens]
MALMKYCNRTGCNKLVPQGVRYCAAHTLDKTAENRQRHREYDAHCRNQTAKDFYNSTAWKTVRAKVMARDSGIDIYLYIMEGRIVPADTVHHITELMEDYSRRCDMDNLISISESTHSMISRAYKDSTKKAEMQRILRECMQAYKRRMNG